MGQLARTVVVVEPSPGHFEHLSRRLRRAGYQVRAVPPDAEASLDGVVAVVAVSGDGDAGATLCARVRRADADIALVLVNEAGAGLDSAVRAIRAGPDEVVPAGHDPAAIVAAVRRAVDQRKLRWHLRRPVEPGTNDDLLAGVVGSSPVMNRLRNDLLRLARTDVSILLTGETGTGKEVAARTLHHCGPRKDAPFVAVNCSAVPARLLESEFFGHVKGAFTGANRDYRGLFVTASGGTLFLDEISSMPLELQAKLLRALQDKRVRPIGGRQEISFDARLISATNRDLDEEIRAGRFREDLYYRLNVVQLTLPPLRDRGDDILELAAHFLTRAARASRKRITGITPAAARLLLGHGWPGNVRELQNCIEVAVAAARFDRITDADLPESLRAIPREALCTPPPSLSEIERAHIVRVLALVGGNKAEAARLLGITRKTLYRKLDRFGLSKSRAPFPSEAGS